MRSLLVSLILVGCSSGGRIEQVEDTISAAEGGTVEIEDREISLAIPPNALAEDTEIAMSTTSDEAYPTLENGVGEVLVLEPENTAFELGASLAYKPSVELTGTETVHAVQLVDGAWTELVATIGSGGVLQTTIYRLAPTSFVIAPETPHVDPETGTVAGSVLHLYLETPLVGYSFTLYDNFEREVGSTESDAEGTFTFAEVAPGDYFVLANVTEAQNCYSDPIDKSFAVTAGATTEVEFFFVPCEE